MRQRAVAAPGRPRIEVTIDEVVLRGVPHHQSHEVLARFESRLSELVTAWGQESSPLHDRAESSRRLAPVDSPAGSPVALGSAVAERVWGDLSSGGRPARGSARPGAAGARR